MGILAKYMLQLLAAATILAFGIWFPNALANALTWLDATLVKAAETAEPTGTLKLVLQFSGAGFMVLMAILVIALGFIMRNFVSETFFRRRYILIAGLIPLLAHVVKWGLGLWWPALLVPVQQLADQLIGWFAPAMQVTLGLFHARDHLMTIIIGFGLMMLWSTTTFLWGRFRGRNSATPPPPPQPPAPRGRNGDTMKTIFKWLGWLLMSPFRIVWRLITAPWRQDGRRGIYLGPISIWLFIICLMTVLATIVVGLFWGLRYLAGNASLADWPFIAIAIGTLTAMGIVYVWKSEKRVVGTSLMIGLTLFGARVRIYLLEGNYNIDLENFLIGSTSKVVKPGTNEQGEFYADIIDFELWGTKDRDPNGKPLHPVIETNSRKGSGVKLRITLKIWLEDPQQWLSPRDAAQLIGDSGRKAGRAAATEVTSFDITDVPKLIGELMRGHTIISARLAHTVGQHRDGCLIYTKGGERIYMTIVTPKDDVSYETEVTAAKAAFLQKLRDMKDQIEDEVWTECSEKNIPRIEEISIESTILATLKEAGAVLQEVLVSDVDLNETEQKAVNKVAAEAQEAVSEARTAKSAAAAATALQTAGGLTPREATMLGAATAGTPVTTINIPGLETLAQAFIAVLGNRKKDNDQ